MQLPAKTTGLDKPARMDDLSAASGATARATINVAGLLESSCLSVPLSRYANCSTPSIARIRDGSWQPWSACSVILILPRRRCTKPSQLR